MDEPQHIKNYLPLNRKIFKHSLWEEKRVYSKFEAWLDLLREARYDQEETRKLIGNKFITWGRGEVPASLRFLAEKWGWSKHKVDNFLSLLGDEGMIKKRTVEGTAQTIISICNYESYNPTQKKAGTAKGTARGQEPGQHGDSTGTARGQNSNKDKKDKKDNNDNTNAGGDKSPGEPENPGLTLAKQSYKSQNCDFGTEFKKQWVALCSLPKWRNKPLSAVEMSLKKLMRYKNEAFAIELIEMAIAGNYRGVVFADADDQYKKFIKKNNNDGTAKPVTREEKEQSRDRMGELAERTLDAIATKYGG